MKEQIKNTISQSFNLIYKNYKFIWLLFTSNLLFGLALALPLFYLLHLNLSHSLMNNYLSVVFDYNWYLQFQNIYKVSYSQYPIIIYSIAGLYILLQLYLTGGLIAVFNNSKKNHHSDFFHGGVTYFMRFLKIFLLSIILYLIAFFIIDQIGDLIRYLFRKSENKIFEFVLKAARYLLLLFFIGIVSLISDYSKIALALKDRYKVWKQIYEAILFIKKNFKIVILVYISVAVLGISGVVIYNLLEKFIPKAPLYFLILTFILQQILIIFRITIKMIFYAAYIVLYKDLTAEVVNVESVEII